MTSTLPSNVGYGTVTGRFLLAYSDSADADLFPDGVPCKGTVLFTPSPNFLKNINATPSPVTILPATISCDLDDDGYLLGYSAQRGVRLISTDDPDNNPSNWTWQVTFRLTDQSDVPTRGIPDFSFQLPTNGTIDLTQVTPVPDSNGVYYLQGPPGPPGPQGPAGNLGTLSATAPITYSNAVIGFSWANTKLDDLGDVSATSPQNNSMLKYNTTNNTWETTTIIDGGSV